MLQVWESRANIQREELQLLLPTMQGMGKANNKGGMMTFRIDSRIGDALRGIATKRKQVVEPFIRDCPTCAKYRPEQAIPCQWFSCVNGEENWYTRRKEK